MLSPLLKGCAVSAIAIALCLMVNAARAESYPSDTPNTGISSASGKPAQVKVRHVRQLVVHPNVSASTKKRSK
jgi:hypothetical protein